MVTLLSVFIFSRIQKQHDPKNKEDEIEIIDSAITEEVSFLKEKSHKSLLRRGSSTFFNDSDQKDVDQPRQRKNSEKSIEINEDDVSNRDIEVKKFMPPLEMLKSIHFQLYVVSSALSQGGVFYNNLSSIIRAAAGHDSLESVLMTETSTQFSAFSASAAISSFLSAYLCDLFSKKNIDILLLPLIFNFIILVPVAMMAFASNQIFTPSFILICSILIGFGSGAIGSIVPSAVREIVGLKFYGIGVSLSFAASPIAILFMSFIYGLEYDSKILPGSDSCYGVSCFSTFFILSLFFQLFSTLLSFWLYKIRNKV